MKVYIRADSSVDIGSGHVMRCLTLAEELRQSGSEVVFLCRDLKGNIMTIIRNRGFQVNSLPGLNCSVSKSNIFSVLKKLWYEDFLAVRKVIHQDVTIPEWLIVDHYSLDIEWETSLRQYVKKIMVIDDLADRKHDCDVLLDQNYYENMFVRYNNLVPDYCKKLIGPRYALLREEFIKARQNLKNIMENVNRILVFFGGSDPTNETIKTLYALKMLNLLDLQIDVVVGSSNPNKQEVENICTQIPSANFHCQIDNMAELMAESDLAIGAGGSAVWERCYLALPTIVIITAENQEAIVNDLSKYGAIISLGRSEDISANILSSFLSSVIQDSALLDSLSQKSLVLMNSHNPGNSVSEISNYLIRMSDSLQ